MNFMDFFAPLNKNNCLYFYIVSVIAGISFAITLLGGIYNIITNYKKMDFLLISAIVQIILSMFLVYFVNRLLYSMCIGSLK
jgi:hypothetical protein